MSQHNRILPSDANDFKYDYERIFYLISALQYSAIAVRHMRSYDVKGSLLHFLSALAPALAWPGGLTSLGGFGGCVAQKDTIISLSDLPSIPLGLDS